MDNITKLNYNFEQSFVLLLKKPYFTEKIILMVQRATNQEELFVLGDGNQIRVKIENHLYKNDFEAVKNVSESITLAIQKLRELAEEELNAEVIMAGGDDILFIMDKFQYDKNILKNMSAIFKEMTGCSFSFGVGTTIEQAHSNLNKAKVFKQTTVQTINRNSN